MADVTDPTHEPESYTDLPMQPTGSGPATPARCGRRFDCALPRRPKAPLVACPLRQWRMRPCLSATQAPSPKTKRI